MSRKLVTLIGLLLIGLLLSGFASPSVAAEEGEGVPWWVWVLIIVVLLAAFLLWWFWWHRRGEEELAPLAKPEPLKAAVPSTPPPAAPPIAQPAPLPVEERLAEIPLAPIAAAVPDDLEVIEGIGPKIAGLLKAAGISTFAQLAGADLGRLDEILQSAGLRRLANPSTWPEQAKLAAAGDWEALEILQGQLKGGR
jgi:predicted flap endonuclease-1-like 5' DNA nuclease